MFWAFFVKYFVVSIHTYDVWHTYVLLFTIASDLGLESFARGDSSKQVVSSMYVAPYNVVLFFEMGLFFMISNH